MTATERIQKIKVLLGLAEAPAPATAPIPETPVALTAYKLADGTEVEISALEVGGIVTVGGAAAPAGDHTLKDGTKLTVDVSGVITEIEAAAPAPPAEAPEDLTAKFAAIESTLAAQGQMIASFDAALKSNGEAIAQLLEIVDAMAKAPTADPVEPAQQRFQKQEPINKAEKFAGLKTAIEKLKK